MNEQCLSVAIKIFSPFDSLSYRQGGGLELRGVINLNTFFVREPVHTKCVKSFNSVHLLLLSKIIIFSE